MDSAEETLEENHESSLEESEKADIDQILDRSQNVGLESALDWEDPFKLKESENAHLEDSTQHLDDGIKYGLAGMGLSAASYVSSGLAFAANQPEIGTYLIAGGGVFHVGGSGAIVAGQARSVFDSTKGMSEFLQLREWQYTDDDLSGLLEESQSVFSSDGSEVKSEDYDRAMSIMENEEKYDSARINGVKWKETDDGDFIYKVVLAEVSDLASYDEEVESTNISIDPLAEYTGRVDRDNFTDYINPVAMKDSTFLGDLGGYFPQEDKASGSIRRGIENIYNKIK